MRGSSRAERLLGIDCLFARFTDGGWAPIWRTERVLGQWAWPWGALTRVDQTDLTRPQSSHYLEGAKERLRETITAPGTKRTMGWFSP